MNLLSASTQTGVNAQPPGEADTRLRGGFLVLARVVWVMLAALTLGLLIATIPGYFAFLHVVCPGTFATCRFSGRLTSVDLRALQALGLSQDFFAWYEIALYIVFNFGFVAIGALIFWRKSDDRMALFASLALILLPAGFNNGQLATLPSAWTLLGQFVAFLGTSSLFLFCYLFPSGRFVPRWTRWLLGGVMAFCVVFSFFPIFLFNAPILLAVLLLGLVGSALGAQIYRYRRVSNAVQQRQTKWVVYGLSIGLGGILVLEVVVTFFPSLVQGPFIDLILGTAYYLVLFCIPLSIGVAILRSRLFDIDLLINRTLVYGILTVIVVGLYVLVVGFLGTLIGTSANLVISLVATGLVAVLFQPLRTWVQRRVNRLLYGQRDEPYSVITQLSQRLESTLAPDAVLSTIVETVAQALKVPYVAILLKQEDTFRLAASAGTLVGDPLVLPLVYQTEMIGHMQLSPRTPGEAFTPADRRLLDELARQAGLSAHAVQLTADLQRSHEQLEQRVEERTRELSLLLEISHTMASTLHLKPLLGLILDQLKLVIDYTGSSILTVEGEDLVFLDHRGPIPQEQLVRLHFPLEQLGPIWQTIASHESILIQNVHEETKLAQALRAAMGELLETTFQYVCSWMAGPLILKDQVIGMLVLTSSEEQAFTARHATLALAIANQAAIAIENARLYAQAQALAAVEERQKSARELHDSVSQALYGISLGAHAVRIALSRDPDHVDEPLDYILRLAETALAEMRALIFELRPESLETEGLVSALSKQGAALQARYEMIVQTNLCEEPALPLTVKQELYRIAQEALQNTVKHANASKVDLVLRRTTSMVILEVCDDGVGFDPTGNFPGHLGLRSMQERVSHLGGKLEIESAPGQGVHLLAQVPWEKPDGE
jgi:signal transduction histidine kinase